MFCFDISSHRQVLHDEAIDILESTPTKIIFIEEQTGAGPLPKNCDLVCDIVSLDGTSPILTITRVGLCNLDNPISGNPLADDVFSLIGLGITVDRPVKYLAGHARTGVRRALAQCPLRYNRKAHIARLCREATDWLAEKLIEVVEETGHVITR